MWEIETDTTRKMLNSDGIICRKWAYSVDNFVEIRGVWDKSVDNSVGSNYFRRNYGRRIGRRSYLFSTNYSRRMNSVDHKNRHVAPLCMLGWGLIPTEYSLEIRNIPSEVWFLKINYKLYFRRNFRRGYLILSKYLFF